MPLFPVESPHEFSTFQRLPFQFSSRLTPKNIIACVMALSLYSSFVALSIVSTIFIISLILYKLRDNIPNSLEDSCPTSLPKNTGTPSES